MIDKPAGLPAGPSRSAEQAEAPNVLQVVGDHLRGRRPGLERVAWSTIPLPDEVSGLMLVARTDDTHHRIQRDLRSNRVQRVFLALVEGAVDAEVGRRAEEGVEVVVRRSPGGGVEGVVRSAAQRRRGGRIADRGPARGSSAPGRPGGARPGLRGSDFDLEGSRPRETGPTHWRLLAVDPQRRLSLLALGARSATCEQLRALCRGMGHPVLGDVRYGATLDPLGRVGLHSTRLHLRHPASGQPVDAQSAPPESFAALLGLDVRGVIDLLDGEAMPQRNAAPTSREQPAAPRAAGSGWDHVAEWYDDLLEGRRGSRPQGGTSRREDQASDLHHEVVMPGALRLLQPRPGTRVLDLACGQGFFARQLARVGVTTVGVDASAKLVEAAKRASEGDPRQHFEVGDVRALDLASLGGPGSFDAVTCIMALMNIDPLAPMMHAAATVLRPGGRFVAVLLHPAFRAPGQTSWGWTGEGGATRPGPPPTSERARTGEGLGRSSRASHRVGSAAKDRSPDERQRSGDAVSQFRRVDAYLTPSRREIVMNPGAAAQGRPSVVTTTFHRPIQDYVRELAAAGLYIDAFEEWPSPRQSAPGPMAQEENRIRREIPMFLAIRAVKAAGD